MKLEALTGGIIQSAFNNFAKFTVEHLCWSLFLIKLQVWWCATFWRKKNSGTRVFLAWTDAWVKWTKTIVFTKSIYWETPVMASFLVQLQTRGLTVFPKRDSITYAFPWKLTRFTEHQFTDQCCATASDFLWHFQCITCLINDRSAQS